MEEMKIVLRTVVARCEVTPAEAKPEPTARRSITFSPRGGATVILRDRVAHTAPEPAAALATV
jgi:cytochrome P450